MMSIGLLILFLTLRTINGQMQEASAVIPDPPDVSNHRNLHLLEHLTCGPLDHQGGPDRIKNGQITGILDYPWMALLSYDTKTGKQFRCAGTILNKRYILTAAHCVAMLPSGSPLIGVRVGDHDIRKERDCEVDVDGVELLCAEKYQDIGIESIHYHPEYSSTKRQNDIALIRLNATIDFRPDSVRAICMPIGSGSMLFHIKAFVTGWNLRDANPNSQVLLQKNVLLVSNEFCHEIYKNITQIWYKQLCAGGENDDVILCYGNGGGPLQAAAVYNNSMVHGTGVRMVQYGIVSYGPRQCSIDGVQDVYTNVAYYMDWILDTIKE